MFSRNKPPEPTPSLPQQKRSTRGQAPSIISSDLVVKGTLVSTGDIQIDGRVEGDVRSAALVIGDNAHIEGEVMAEEATIRGHVVGRIRARKVQLCTTAHVEGDILHEALAVETGAYFQGNCRHSENPLSDGADELKKTESFERKSGGTLSGLKPLNGGADETRPAATSRTAASFTPLKSGS